MTDRRLRMDISLTKFIGEAAKDLQKLRRLECADNRGFCECISCGRKAHYKTMQGGHFISRNHKSTVLNESNIWPQCVSCNQHKHGNLGEYRRRLCEIIGTDGVDLLEASKYKIKQFTREELADMRENYRLRIKREKERLGE